MLTYSSQRNRPRFLERLLLVVLLVVALVLLVVALFGNRITIALTEGREHLLSLTDVSVIATNIPTHYVGLVVGPLDPMAVDTLVLRTIAPSVPKKGARVYADVSRYAIGEVRSVSGGTALVSLYSIPGTTIFGRMAGYSELVSLEGIGDGQFTVELPVTFTISPGTPVYGSASGKLLGKVSAVDFDERYPTQTVYVRAVESLRMLEVLYIER